MAASVCAVAIRFSKEHTTNERVLYELALEARRQSALAMGARVSAAE